MGALFYCSTTTGFSCCELLPFCCFWKQTTPQVIVSKPMSDLCWACQKNSTLIMRSHNKPVEEKTVVYNVIVFTVKVAINYNTYIYIIWAVQRAEEHLLLVTQERSLYKQALDESKRQTQAHFLLEGKFTPPPPHAMIAPASNDILVHYSFDFAQQVYYPSNLLQPGPIYFLTPKKAAIFEVCCEAIPKQVNFVLDEPSDTGKGANTVVSMLDLFSATMASAKPPSVCMLTTVMVRIKITP